MLQPNELTRPIHTGHGRWVDHDLLRQFFRSFYPGEDKYRIYFWLMLETGMRSKECCAVQEQDFSKDYRKLKLVTCKYPTIRSCTLSDFLARAIKNWCEHNRQNFKYGYIFPVPNTRHQHITPHHVRNFLSRKRQQMGHKPVRRIEYGRQLGFRKTTYQKVYSLACHSFRRFYETHKTDLAGGNYMLIASLMGYDDPSIVRKYYDDMVAMQQEEKLHAKYVERISSGIVQDRPLQPKNQRTLTGYQNIWAKLKKLPDK